MFNPDITDTAHSAQPAFAVALNNVGMQHIDLLLTLAELPQQPLAAKADISVNLPRPDIKGIHMSRLYQHLYQWAQAEPVTPATLARLLPQLLHSQQECGSNTARLCLRSNIVLQRPALKSPGLAGFKAYPVMLNANLNGSKFNAGLSIDIGYSSTCPCSAALSRQLLSEQFSHSFAPQSAVSVEQASQWLLQHGSVATPHSQRSVASISVTLSPDADSFGIAALIDCAEQALATPLQTAVKRADEQEFARLNGANLMFVEDAARRLHAGLSQHYPAFAIKVAHLESLHPHDAVASISVNYPEPGK